LLYRKHPELYRRMIEVKRVYGVEVRRPMHYACVAYGALMVVAGAGLLVGLPWVAAAGLTGALFSSWLVRYKYQGKRALRLERLLESAGFAVLPAVYLTAVVRGCCRFRSFGVLA
jgi:hypothetical protein